MPALEPFVRARCEHYDAAYVSADPAFTHAHITVLGPFLPEPSAEELARVEAIVAATPPIVFGLHFPVVFDNGMINLVPEPDAAFRKLTAEVYAAFPQCPPYGRASGEVTPHLTLDRHSPVVSVESTRRLLGDAVPVSCRAERVDLAWYQPHRCRLLTSWPLGSAA